MINIDDGNLTQEILEAKTLALLDFGAAWCAPCKKIEPVLEELAGEYDGQVVIGHCDVGNARQTATQFGVMSIPTVVFFKGGKELERFSGLRNKEQIDEIIRKHL